MALQQRCKTILLGKTRHRKHHVLEQIEYRSAAGKYAPSSESIQLNRPPARYIKTTTGCKMSYVRLHISLIKLHVSNARRPNNKTIALWRRRSAEQVVRVLFGSACYLLEPSGAYSCPHAATPPVNLPNATQRALPTAGPASPTQESLRVASPASFSCGP